MISNFRRTICIVGAISVLLLMFNQSASANPVLAPGVWTDISPEHAGGDIWYVRVDPSNPGTIYAGTGGAGLRKSTDAGSTWTRIDVCPYIAGIEIDPKNSQHLYMGGWDNGDFWVSNDGGATWTRKPLLASPDIGGMTVDPTDFNHVLVSWHYVNYGNGTIVESKDGGNTWRALFIPGVEGVFTKGIHFLCKPEQGIGNSNTIMVTDEGTGFWRTTDGGANWTPVAPGSFGIHGAIKTIYYTKSGTLYVPAYNVPIRSTDNGITWESVGGNLSPSYYDAIIGDGNTLYLGSTFANSPMYTALESNGKQWATWQTLAPGPHNGFALDTVHRILYSAEGAAGVWALKVGDLQTSVVTTNSTNKTRASAGARIVLTGMTGSVPGGTRQKMYDVKGCLVDEREYAARIAVLGRR